MNIAAVKQNIEKLIYFAYYITKISDSITYVQVKDLYARNMKIPIKNYENIQNITNYIYAQCVPPMFKKINCYFSSEYEEESYSSKLLFNRSFYPDNTKYIDVHSYPFEMPQSTKFSSILKGNGMFILLIPVDLHVKLNMELTNTNDNEKTLIVRETKFKWNINANTTFDEIKNLLTPQVFQFFNMSEDMNDVELNIEYENPKMLFSGSDFVSNYCEALDHQLSFQVKATKKFKQYQILVQIPKVQIITLSVEKNYTIK